MSIHQESGNDDDRTKDEHFDEPQDGIDNAGNAAEDSLELADELDESENSELEIEDDIEAQVESEAEPEIMKIESDETLPWLESDYDTNDDEGGDTGRLIGFGLFIFLALALLLAGIWYFMRERSDPSLVADGSTIEAPDGPIKERPVDAGGKEFAGAGNVAPIVGEGKTTEGHLATDDAPKPSIDAAVGVDKAGTDKAGADKAGATGNADSAGKSGTASATGGVGVQVGAYGSQDRANAAWGTLSGQSNALNGVKYRVVKGQVDGGTVYRLQAVASDAAAANKLCKALKADGIACQVK